MMRTILVPLAPGLASQPALDAALAIAKRMNSHIRALYVRPDPDAAIGYFPEIAATAKIDRDAIASEDQKAAEGARARFDAWRSQHGIPETLSDGRLDTCFATWTEQTCEIETAVTHFGRVSDLIVMTRRHPADTMAARCLDSALFGSGRPALLVPNAPFGDMLSHVMIAWNGSLEASHAVFAAMPLLRAAQWVSTFYSPEGEPEKQPGAELVEALSWYGIRVHEERPSKAAGSVGADLLKTAHRVEATMIVMGAYTHSRLRQAFLGGVTRRVLQEAPIPVLMCH